MRYRINQNLLGGLIFISLIFSSFNVFCQSPTVQVFSVKDYVMFYIDNLDERTLYFENISFRNITDSYKDGVKIVKPLDTMYYSLKGDSLTFDYKRAVNCSWKWRADSLRPAERKLYLIRLDKKNVKLINNVEFLYYNDAKRLSYAKTYSKMIKKKRWKQLRLK